MAQASAQAAWNAFIAAQSVSPSSAASEDENPGFRREYDALAEGPAVVDRSYRGLLEVRGDDRVPWLHNLLTNQVKPLGTGDGVYAFALNVQGRILFDCNLWVRPEFIWVDIARDFLATAQKHLQKYHITERVELIDRSDEYVRIGFSGVLAKQVATEMGAPQAVRMPVLGITTATWRGTAMALVRHDFCGPFGIEVVVPAAQAVDFWQDWTLLDRPSAAVAAGNAAVETRRIEAGIPWPGREITDEYLPAETGQMSQAVSNQKGCYLGQEIVERMRARAVVARKLSGLVLAGYPAPARGAIVFDEAGKPVGVITSSCHSPALGASVALSYLKSGVAVMGREVQVAGTPESTTGLVHELPFVRWNRD